VLQASKVTNLLLQVTVLQCYSVTVLQASKVTNLRELTNLLLQVTVLQKSTRIIDVTV